MDLSVVIVNWNSAEYLRKCLASIYSNVRGISFEVVVVDNASYDGSEGIIKKEFPRVIFIQSDRNLGFSKANNTGFARSTGRNLLFLNPDTEVFGDAINVMLETFESLVDGGSLGCKLLNSDLSLQTSCIQPFPTIINQLLDIDYLKMKIPRLKFWGMKPLFSNSGKPEEVQVISGACIMVKREIFERVGGFSEEYFMYSEDIDLCYKIQQVGYKNYYTGEATLIHHGGGSSKRQERSFFGAALMRESVFIFLKKTRGSLVAHSFKLTMLASSLLRLIVLGGLVTLFKQETLSAPMGKWKSILRWTIGMEKRALEAVLNQ